MKSIHLSLCETKQPSRDVSRHVQNRSDDFQSSSIRSDDFQSSSIRRGDFQSSNVVTTLAVDRHYLSGVNPVTTNMDVASRVPTTAKILKSTVLSLRETKQSSLATLGITKQINIPK